MVKHTQTIRWLLPTNCLRVFDHFVGLAIKGLKPNVVFSSENFTFNKLIILHQQASA